MNLTIKKLSQDDFREMEIYNWPIWEKEVSKFNWSYDEKEQFYLIEGEIKIKTKDGEFDIKPGDYVECSKGLDCDWEVTSYVKKHYQFIEE